ncbi:hypothetical protein QE152_g18173 [Popillia japonica]|uniref:Zinc finger PHD-type domain-containing protein n=1 Tax=Popillia japonica TaxID=7064 RepID=A0AAW1L470_POPJA
MKISPIILTIVIFSVTVNYQVQSKAVDDVAGPEYASEDKGLVGSYSEESVGNNGNLPEDRAFVQNNGLYNSWPAHDVSRGISDYLPNCKLLRDIVESVLSIIKPANVLDITIRIIKAIRRVVDCILEHIQKIIEAYGKAASIQNAVNGFKNSDIQPFDSDIFPDHLFAPSAGKDDQVTCQEALILHPSTSSSWIRPEEISPRPRTENTKRRKQTTGSQVFTESFVLAEIKAKDEAKRNAEVRRSANRAKKNIKMQLNVSDEEEENNMNVEDDAQEDVACIFCNDVYSRSKLRESWIRCQICSKWTHCECAGVGKKIKNYICELCQ